MKDPNLILKNRIFPLVPTPSALPCNEMSRSANRVNYFPAIRITRPWR